MLQKFISRIISVAAWFGVIISIVLMIDIIVPYLGFNPQEGFLRTKQRIIHLTHWRISFYIHVFSGSFVLLAGLTQFSRYIQTAFPRLHRAAGYFYVIILLLLTAPTGLLMSFYANGGSCAQTGFVLMSLLWIITTWFAWRYAMKGDITKHRQYMIRSYAITLSAISLRLFAWIIPHFYLMDGRMFYIFLAWVSWLFNLLVAETIIRASLFRRA